MTENFLTGAGLLSIAVGNLVVGLLLGLMIGRRSMNKHLAAAPQQFNELSAQLETALAERVRAMAERIGFLAICFQSI
jgi:hypothetical protein